MKRVLLITYYWPPSGGAGVQRVLKLVKYLRDFGWEPVVYTAKDAAYPVLDESLLADVPTGQEVLKGDIWEPYEVYKSLIGQKGKKQVYSGFCRKKKSPHWLSYRSGHEEISLSQMPADRSGLPLSS